MMRVRILNTKSVVTIKYWSFSSKHVALLMQLQAEVPSLPLPIEPIGSVLVSDLDLSHEELRFLNP